MAALSSGAIVLETKAGPLLPVADERYKNAETFILSDVKTAY
jgi:hypothetical protein